jgi:hypothetical protein
MMGGRQIKYILQLSEKKRQHCRMEILFEESGTELSAFAAFLHNQLPLDLRRLFEVVENFFFLEGLFYESKTENQ